MTETPQTLPNAVETPDMYAGGFALDFRRKLSGYSELKVIGGYTSPTDQKYDHEYASKSETPESERVLLGRRVIFVSTYEPTCEVPQLQDLTNVVVGAVQDMPEYAWTHADGVHELVQLPGLIKNGRIRVEERMEEDGSKRQVTDVVVVASREIGEFLLALREYWIKNPHGAPALETGQSNLSVAHTVINMENLIGTADLEALREGTLRLPKLSEISTAHFMERPDSAILTF